MKNTQLIHRTIQLEAGTIFITESGSKDAPAILFLHGWPENWEAWRHIISLASKTHHVIAIDLPGIGKSAWPHASGNKLAIARIVHELIKELDLQGVTLVGHDIGGQVVYAYLTEYNRRINQAVIIDVAIPGVVPWEEVVHNPYIWHFAFHAVPKLPEELVRGRQITYFNYFYDTIAAQPKAINTGVRKAYATAYHSDSALKTGFEWYRSFTQDAEENQKFYKSGGVIKKPLLYIRGAEHPSNIDAYKAGLQAAGFQQITTALIKGSGHFVAEEQPEALWEHIRTFIH